MYIRNLVKEVIPFFVKLLLVFFVLLLTLLIGSRVFFDAAREATPGSAKEMSVEGTAKRKVTPDSARITLAKNLRGTNINDLQSKAADSVNKLTAKLQEAGVKPEQMKTSNYNLNPIYNTDGDIRSYAINVAVEITLEKVKPQDALLSKVIAAGSASGIDEVRNLNFYLADQDKVVKDMEDEAIADAKATAQKRASAAGANLGKVIRVDVGGRLFYGSAAPTAALDKSANDAGSIQLNAGEFDLQSSVTVVYELN